jgi:uncharacterized protein YndB with AHSA1/START domain
MTPASPDLGTLTLDGGFVSLEFCRRLPHPPEMVWKAVTDRAERSIWYLATGRLEPWVGGEVEMVAGPLQLRITGRVLQWDPPRLLEHEWKVLARPEQPQGEDSVIRWELIPDGEGTVLHLTHRHLVPRTAEGILPGTHVFLDRVAAHLGGAPLRDLRSQYREAGALYRPAGPSR